MDAIFDKLQSIVSRHTDVPTLLPEGTTLRDLLIKATLYNDYDMVVDLIGLDEFDNSILQDTGMFDVLFPLHYITVCYNAPGLLEGFMEELMPDVECHKKGRDALLRLWADHFGLDVNVEIDYNKMQDYFFCSHDDDTFEDVFYKDLQYFLDKGYRQIDIDLYDATKRFRFDKVKPLLDQGASPNARFIIEGENFDDEFSCFSHLGHECSYLATHCFQKNKYYNKPLTGMDVRDLIGWSAFEKMYSLMEQYEEPKFF